MQARYDRADRRGTPCPPPCNAHRAVTLHGSRIRNVSWPNTARTDVLERVRSVDLKQARPERDQIVDASGLTEVIETARPVEPVVRARRAAAPA